MARQRVYIGADPSIDPAEPDPLQPLHSPAANSPSPDISHPTGILNCFGFSRDKRVDFEFSKTRFRSSKVDEDRKH